MTEVHRKFLGVWQLERVIEDALTGNASQFSGEARIHVEGANWHYREIGQLKISGAAAMTAERCYIWRPTATGFDVFFEDLRFFHSFELGQANNAAHWCDPDQYDVAYDFADWPKWTSTWRVKGPKKDYRMESAYSLALS